MNPSRSESIFFTVHRSEVFEQEAPSSSVAPWYCSSVSNRPTTESFTRQGPLHRSGIINCTESTLVHPVCASNIGYAVEFQACQRLSDQQPHTAVYKCGLFFCTHSPPRFEQRRLSRSAAFSRPNSPTRSASLLLAQRHGRNNRATLLAPVNLVARRSKTGRISQALNNRLP